MRRAAARRRGVPRRRGRSPAARSQRSACLCVSAGRRRPALLRAERAACVGAGARARTICARAPSEHAAAAGRGEARRPSPRSAPYGPVRVTGSRYRGRCLGRYRHRYRPRYRHQGIVLIPAPVSSPVTTLGAGLGCRPRHRYRPGTGPGIVTGNGPGFRPRIPAPVPRRRGRALATRSERSARRASAPACASSARVITGRALAAERRKM